MVFISIVIFISNKIQNDSLLSEAEESTPQQYRYYRNKGPREYACEAGSRPLSSLSCKTGQRRAMPRLALTPVSSTTGPVLAGQTRHMQGLEPLPAAEAI